MSGESAFIDLLKGLATSEAARGLADDAAVVPFGDAHLVLTHDMMVEGVHWPEWMTPEDVAWKLVAVNLSDLAAKGAETVGVLLGFTLGDGGGAKGEWDRRFAEGLGEALAAMGAPLLGGDTVSAPKGSARSLGLTAVGRCDAPPPARSGAKPDDALWLVGAIGEAMAGFRLGGEGDSAFAPLDRAFARPLPLLDEGRAVARVAHAMMDVSDGLLLDAQRMAQASGLAVAIDSEAVPVSEAMAAWLDTLDEGARAEALASRLRWGDDYALIAAAADGAPPVEGAVRVGRFAAGKAGTLLLDGRAVGPDDPLGYRHGEP